MLRAGAKTLLGLGGYIGSVIGSAALPAGGEWQLAEHWPLLVLIIGGLGALWMGGKQLIALYDAFLNKLDTRAAAAVTRGILEHTRAEEERFNELIDGQRALHDQLEVLIDFLTKTSTPGHGTPTVIPAFKAGSPG